MEQALFGVAYRITCLVNNKAYIGITSQLKGYDPSVPESLPRWRQHVNWNGRLSVVARAIRKYGAENFKIEVIASSWSETDLLALETLLICQEGTRSPNGYNLNDGGKGSLNPSAETRQKLSDALSGKPKSPEHARKIGDMHKGNTYWVGRKHRLESIKKQSASRLGKEPWNKGTTGGQVAWNKGVKRDESWWTGKKHAPAAIQKQRKAAAERVKTYARGPNGAFVKRA